MVRGLAVCCLMAVLVFASPVMAGFVPDGKELISTGLKSSKVEVLLPPGADVIQARGSLIIEAQPIVDRILADGSLAKTLPVIYTFVNHWHETFMFDGFNEAVLTDVVGEKHFATSVLRDGQALLPGVTGLIPHGGMTEFTLYYDLSADTNPAAVSTMQLDLRYLNHGHPYLLSTLIASESGADERPTVVEIAPPPAPMPEVPPPVVPEPVVVKEQPAPPVVVPIAPAPEPPVVASVPEPILPPVVVSQPVPEPQVVVPPPPVPAPELIAPAPVPVIPVAQPLPVQCMPCPPCMPCRPVCNPCGLLNLCKLPVCLLNVVCRGAQCLTCVTAKGVCDITNGTCSSVKCVLGSVCGPTCNPCAPCYPCNPCAPCYPCAPGGMPVVQ